MSDEQKILESLTEEIDQIWLIDTHEHMDTEEYWLNLPEGACDFTRLCMLQYVPTDINSSGCPPDVQARITNPDTPLDEKWDLVEPYWERAKFTGYGKAIRRAVKDIFDLPDLSRDTYRELTKRMLESRKPGWFKKVLKDCARIEKSIQDGSGVILDPEIFVYATRFDDFIMVSNRNELAALEKKSGMSIFSLDDLIAALEKVFKEQTQPPTVTLKTGIAYLRTLYFEKTSKHEAESAFNKLFSSKGYEHYKLNLDEAKPLQDYIMHKVIQLAIEAGLPFQIHTGLQEGNGNYLANSNPLLLSNLFMTYKQGRFDIFHAGYPFTSEVGVLAKMFPGVHANLCWMHIISPAAARRTLDEWIETMPVSKIFGFGGDFCFVEGAYGHSRIARENIARVLAAKVADGYLTQSEASSIARMLLRDNAKDFFGI